MRQPARTPRPGRRCHAGGRRRQASGRRRASVAMTRRPVHGPERRVGRHGFADRRPSSASVPSVAAAVHRWQSRARWRRPGRARRALPVPHPPAVTCLRHWLAARPTTPAPRPVHGPVERGPGSRSARRLPGRAPANRSSVHVAVAVRNRVSAACRQSASACHRRRLPHATRRQRVAGQASRIQAVARLTAHTSPCLLASTAASARLETLSFL